MANWWEKYLNKPWKAEPEPPHSFNCGELLRRVYWDEFGIETLPILADASDLRQCIKAMTGERYGLAPLKQTDRPRNYDSVFMARGKFDDHCGIAAGTVEGLLVLHCLQGVGVVLESVGELAGRGLKHLSWYRHERLN